MHARQKRKHDPNHPRHSEATRKLRAEMKRRGMNARALAMELGFTVLTVKTLLTRGVEKHSARLAIEHYFGIPFWSDPYEMAYRHSLLKEKFGSDHPSISRAKAKALAHELRISCGGKVFTKHLPLLIADKAVQNYFRDVGLASLREKSSQESPS